MRKTRDRKAALMFIKKAMRRYGRPQEIVTDRLRSYGAALKDLGRGDDREMGRWVNNRAENSHLPFRRRERAMLRFRQMRSLQKFASVQVRFTTTSIRNARSTPEKISKPTVPLLWSSGAAFLLPEAGRG